MYTEDMLVQAVRSMGVKETDVLTVHTSLKSVGSIDDSKKSGAQVLIDALRCCVKDGILMVPAHTFVNVCEEPIFNVRETKPCIGAVPCMAVEMANRAFDAGDDTCIRSVHPSHSIVAFGKKAKEFAWDDRFSVTRTPMTGSYGKLYEKGGKILLIGVGLTRNTFIHAIDETLDDRVVRTLNVTFTDYDGDSWERELILTEQPSSLTFSRYKEALEGADAIVYGKVGDADSMLIDARKCFDVIVEIRRLEIAKSKGEM